MACSLWSKVEHDTDYSTAKGLKGGTTSSKKMQFHTTPFYPGNSEGIQSEAEAKVIQSELKQR